MTDKKEKNFHVVFNHLKRSTDESFARELEDCRKIAAETEEIKTLKKFASQQTEPDFKSYTSN
jgi:hypothetical protein